MLIETVRGERDGEGWWEDEGWERERMEGERQRMWGGCDDEDGLSGPQLQYRNVNAQPHGLSKWANLSS